MVTYLLAELKLNFELEKIQNWMNANKLTVNLTETKFILFSKISPFNSGGLRGVLTGLQLAAPNIEGAPIPKLVKTCNM